MNSPIYIIEHLEPELFEWCLIEYAHISEIVGKENLWFTNINGGKDKKKLEKFGRVYSESVQKLGLNNMCVLDPEAEKTLNSGDSDKIEYYIFGGILGDFPPRKRTEEELTKFLPNSEKRNIGKEQMSTDNAVYTVKQIVGGKKFEELRFIDNAYLDLGEFESVELPYRYNLVGGKPLMSKKILAYLKKNGVFR
ncbi:MAG: SAM-dependent methyltransferase [archaeon]|nr:SAM-dependent methyltransferase [archaeon]